MASMNGIERQRRLHFLTQRELADVLGVTIQTISNWERGTSAPGTKMLILMSEYFAVPVDDLLKTYE